jgi:hypothetical protein
MSRRNEELYHSSEKLASSNLQYRSPNEDIYHPRMGTKRFSVSVENIWPRPGKRTFT